MIYAAFLLGLVSSLHCVGMCAPLTLALPYHRDKVVFQILTYNFGRVITYGLLGLIFGLLGEGLAVAGFQKIFSIFFGCIFISLALVTLIKKWEFNLKFNNSGSKFIRQSFSKVLRWRAAYFWLGMLNGFLPCGIVYWAIASSLMTFDAFQGSLFMLIFGIGTVPLMLIAVLFKNRLSREISKKFYHFIPLYQLFLGILLIWRALNINIATVNMLAPAPMCH